VKYPALWGILTFFTNYIPNIGSFLAAVPTVVVALVDRGWGGALLMAMGFLVVEGFSGYVLEPRWASKDLGISTLVVFLSLVFWGWVLGAAGMLLSVPLTIAVKIALETDPSTRWIALLLGSESDPVELERTMGVPAARVPIAGDGA
jgi:predicted PurR-regulated permease PerM